MNSQADHSRRIFTVGELNGAAGKQLEQQFGSVWVTGELHEIRRPASGHWYMTLKDDDCELRCVMFRGANQHVLQPPNQGDQLNISGRLSIYGPRGQYQLIAQQMEPAGEGLLLRRFAELRQRLQNEGLFDSDRKTPLPEHPHRIAVITSATGAAVRDVLAVTSRRAPLMRLTLIPALVQGDAAAPSLCRAMDICEQWNSLAAPEQRFEAVLLCRGGGSLADLWAFNEEAVVRRICNLRIPSISGIGHEVDSTLSDFAADVRAATPSAAAEILTTGHSLRPERLHSAAALLQRHFARRLKELTRRTDQLDERLLSPKRYMEQRAQKMDDLAERLRGTVLRLQAERSSDFLSLQNRLTSQIATRRPLAIGLAQLRQKADLLLQAIRPLQKAQMNRIQAAEAKLSALNPKDVLKRGYAIARTRRGKVLRRSDQAEMGQPIEVLLSAGSLQADITAIKPPAKTGDRQ